MVGTCMEIGKKVVDKGSGQALRGWKDLLDFWKVQQDKIEANVDSSSDFIWKKH